MGPCAARSRPPARPAASCAGWAGSFADRQRRLCCSCCRCSQCNGRVRAQPMARLGCRGISRLAALRPLPPFRPDPQPPPALLCDGKQHLHSAAPLQAAATDDLTTAVLLVAAAAPPRTATAAIPAPHVFWHRPLVQLILLVGCNSSSHATPAHNAQGSGITFVGGRRSQVLRHSARHHPAWQLCAAAAAQRALAPR